MQLFSFSLLPRFIFIIGIIMKIGGNNRTCVRCGEVEISKKGIDWIVTKIVEKSVTRWVILVISVAAVLFFMKKKMLIVIQLLPHVTSNLTMEQGRKNCCIEYKTFFYLNCTASGWSNFLQQHLFGLLLPQTFYSCYKKVSPEILLLFQKCATLKNSHITNSFPVYVHYFLFSILKYSSSLDWISMCDANKICRRV